jgi:hypothetical protein
MSVIQIKSLNFMLFIELILFTTLDEWSKEESHNNFKWVDKFIVCPSFVEKSKEAITSLFSLRFFELI